MVMDPTGYLRRIMNQGAAETFDQTTDSLEAIANALGIGPSVGLWMFGVVDVTQIASTITIITNNLQNVPNDLLEGQFWMQVLLNTSAPATAPEGEIRHITNFAQGGALQTFTVDAFSANVEAGDFVCIFHESLLSHQILGTGTLTLSSATVPEDNLRLEVDNYFNGCLLMPTEGACRFQPRRIVDWAVGGGGVGTGIFTLDPNNPFTGVPGIVDYVILGDQTEFVPGVDGVNNRIPSDVMGGKADTPVLVPDNVSSAMRYLKGMVNSCANIFALVRALLVLTETSGTLTTTGGEDNVYINNAPAGVFSPKVVKIDTSNMVVGQTIVVKYYERIVGGGAWVLFDQVIFAGVQGLPGKLIKLAQNRFGVWVSVERTLGGALDLDWEALYKD